ncbi:DUF2975 domain-containing protein [Zunongwangia sp. HGR-M22]|uniref:DUF2975 domain-containing protein n=1 Tax=Zunongwangia sp. HGR-M22 TaxID=3015168 RepID=UPI0022DE4631|nr:DUF2975 domain-containing protein [Zunongwangia sp. HGR-M22]WBL25422.1 DUF2975 domain-containing protein [Zunongwangia sp. HGR-M22]
MKPPKILKHLLEFCYAAMLIIVLVTPLQLFFQFYSDNEIALEVNKRMITDFTLPIITLCIFRYFLIALEVYIIYLIKKLIDSFFENKLYSADQIHLFKKVGLFIIYTSLAKIISNIVANILIDPEEFRVSLDIGFNNLLFIIAVGLLFVFLSKVFKNARETQKENELTI